MNKCELCDKKALARNLCQNHYMQKRRAGQMPLKQETDAQYILNRIAIDADGHWRWQKSTHNGYGRLMRVGKSYAAHVFSYATFVGEIPEGAQINHKCHKRDCVNPAHLYAGSQKENMQDMREAGRDRVLRGKENGMARLSEEQAAEIIKTTGEAMPIANKYGVSRSLIYAIRKGACWRHLREKQEQQAAD